MRFQNLAPRYHNNVVLFMFLLFTTTDLSFKGRLVGATMVASTARNILGNETDKLALLAIKAQITEDPFRVMSSWNESLHFCQWQGVTCGRRHNQRVTRLNLRLQRLGGQISPSITNLSFIRVIDLSDNSLHGEIPHEMSHLFRLQRLILANNSLVGQIPPNLSFCSNLMGINFDRNNLTGEIPFDLGSLPRLTHLRVFFNNLRGNIPPNLGNLSSLRTLGLVRNQLEGQIPSSFGWLKNMEWLFLSGNRFSGAFPQSIFNLSKIRFLFMPDNQLKGQLPRDIGLTLPNIERFVLAKTRFSGTLPISIANMTNLAMFQISNTGFFGGVPDVFGNLKDLFNLQLDSTNLGSGNADDLHFFAPLKNCSNLKIVDVSWSNYGGSLPAAISNFSTQLYGLSIGGNPISGKIPSGVGNLISLIGFSVERTLLRGAIPVAIGKLNKLQKLALHGNRFSGEIPLSLGNLTSLIELRLGNNNLQGSIPSSMGNCTNLLRLDLSTNSLNGTIPRAVIGLSSLSLVLNLSRNNLVGSLPSEVGKLENLGQLDISHNLLQGIIPDSLRLLRSVGEIDLSHNNFSGQIPKDIEKMGSLLKLDLSFNDLQGELPTGGVFSNASAISVSGNHKLCGGIPQLRLQACTKKQSSSFRGAKLIISIVFGILAISILLYFLLSWWFKKKRKQQIDTSPTNPFTTISYGDLLKATDGFSSENLIGVGSVGSVYKGILEEDQMVIAVKVFNLQKRGASKSFAAECETLRGVRHRNLVKIITACSSIDYQGNEFKALVYELMPNGNLENFLHPGPQTESPLTLSKRVDIAIDVASAVDYLHNNVETPILHCDLKPSNILLDQENVAHVGDFGLSRIVPQDNAEISNNQSNSSGLKGTIGYAAPEYGMGSKVSKEGDMYSFGILLLEIFTVKRPTGSDFGEGMNLNQFVKSSLPERVMEIVDQGIFTKEDDEPACIIRNEDREMMKIRECCVSVLEIGVICSDEFPRARMKINEALKKLYAAKKRLLEINE